MPCCASVIRHISVEQSVLQLFGWIVGCFALLIGSYAVQNDLDWNKIIEGKADLKLGTVKTSPGFRLNLTLQQQAVLMRNSRLEIVCLIGLSLFLLISIGVYTFVWIKDSKMKPSRVSCVITIFHGLGSILLACLSISELNGIVEISGHDKNICVGRYTKDLYSKNAFNSTFLKFIQDASCVCTHWRNSVEFDDVIYYLDSLKDFGICQSSSLKQIAGVSLFVYTTIAIALACTQLKGLIAMKSSEEFNSTPYRNRSKPVGYQYRNRQFRTGHSNKQDYCTCSSDSIMDMDTLKKDTAESIENNNYFDFGISQNQETQTHSIITAVDAITASLEADVKQLPSRDIAL